ncbi:dienelactone hydrolase family protein [Pontimicrobium aquaticum]|uniref:Dienelactone hydrolase domain-containing protein n=1 Tax=Pontimicrobium aquaticum TaxID=2565367 RepID=A0A4V6WE83_9FLAO|nr:hypothetical protein [Pontimicrobium aquaticum]TJY33359.1 hypothetical protein E5167_12720 [Pontimicrobium aquaticum]
MKKNLYLVIAIAICTLTSYSQSIVTNHLKYGEFSVGYKVFHEYDYSRSFHSKYDYYGNPANNTIGRPMQISMWYPAEANNTLKKMQLKDYIGYSASEIDFSKNTLKDRLVAINNFIKTVDASKQDLITNLLNKKTYSVLNAEEMANDFPIIIYAPPMNTSATDNYIICEYLASKGYIVVSALAKGQYTALQDRTVATVHTQAEDLAFLLGFAKKTYTNNNIGVFGFSLGGLANIVFATKNKAIDATISLDGSVMSQGWLNTIKDSKLYNPEEFTSNLLLIGKNLSAPEQNPSIFYDRVKYADKALIRYNHNQHSYFSGLNLLYEMILDDTLTFKEKETNYAFYAEMTKYVGDFFDQYLKNKNTFKEFDKKLYKHNFVFKKGLRKPLDPKSIGKTIIDKGFDYTNKVINDILKHETQYLKKLDWRELLQASISLKNNERLDEAIETLLLSNKVFPNWFVTNHQLGKLYLEKENETLAEACFRTALKDNPRHFESLQALNDINKEVTDYHKTKIDNTVPYLGKYVVDKERYRNIYIENDKLYLSSNYWDEPVELWPYTTNTFLVESDNPRNNMQVLFQFDDDNNVKSLSIRGLNSGRINEPNLKKD